MKTQNSEEYIKIKEEVRLILEKYPIIGYLGLILISRIILFISKQFNLWFFSIIIYALFYVLIYFTTLHEFNAPICFLFLIVHFIQWEFYTKKMANEMYEDSLEFEWYIQACKEVKKENVN